MVVSSIVRRLLVALALCTAAFAASSSSASARSYRHARHTAHVRYVVHSAGYVGGYAHPFMARETASAPRWQMEGGSRWGMTSSSHWDMAGASQVDAEQAPRRNRAIARLRERRFAHVQASVVPGARVQPEMQVSVATTAHTGEHAADVSAGFGGGSDLVSEARRYLGGNPTSRGSLWCARFMNMVLARTGHHGTGSDMASSFAHYGHPISGPQVGAIAVMGHHVGIITGVDSHGNPIMISGNNGNRVREAPISRGRIYAYVMPN
jgi:uncharacterized protein (TIGR02594 family)